MKRVQTFWDDLPKVIKVGVYMFVASVLEQFVQTLSPAALTFIPALYRVVVFNFVVVLVVEAVKRLRALNGKK